jgi:hypothetical protein
MNYIQFPISAILVQILVNTSIPVSSSICNTRRYWSLPNYEHCRYRKILGNTGNTSIADTGRFWKILGGFRGEDLNVIFYQNMNKNMVFELWFLLVSKLLNTKT